MKKKILLLVLSCFLLTGCIKSNTDMTINKDKSMDISTTYMISNYLLNLGNDDEDGNTIDAQNENTRIDKESTNWKNLEKRGYELIEITDGDYSGFKATKHIKNIDDVSIKKAFAVDMSKFLENYFNDNELFTVRKGLFKNKYTARFTFDLTSKDVKQNNNDTENINFDDLLNGFTDLTGSMTFQYKVTLPTIPLSNNATNVSEDKLSYIWNMNYGEITNVEYSFELTNVSNIILMSISAIAFIIGVVLLIIVYIRRKR